MDIGSGNRVASEQGGSAPQDYQIQVPTINLPKGGGAIRGIGEKFSANPVTGTGSMSVPIYASPGRSGFGPQLALTYDSGAGNGVFGLGWNLSLASITRRTDKGLPRYLDREESDVFILSGAEDLVPLIDQASGNRIPPSFAIVATKRYLICRYRPRIEGLFAWIERWTEEGAPANSFWRTISRDNITSWYGRSEDSRIFDPSDHSRIFQWLVSEIHDDKGNVSLYTYVRENGDGVDQTRVEETNRSEAQRRTNCYPKRVFYGNLKPYLPALTAEATAWPTPQNDTGQGWMFELVFDYGEHEGDAPTPMPTPGKTWTVRADPFSSYRAGFEVRTYRLCRRVLMFHHFFEGGFKFEVQRDWLSGGFRWP